MPGFLRFSWIPTEEFRIDLANPEMPEILASLMTNPPRRGYWMVNFRPSLNSDLIARPGNGIDEKIHVHEVPGVKPALGSVHEFTAKRHEQTRLQ